MKTAIITVSMLLATFVAPSVVLAQDPVCVTQYGGATVCGAATPQFHTFKQTGLADFNLPLIGTMSIIASVTLYWKNKRSLTI